MLISTEPIARPANASGINLRLLQKSNFTTVAKLLTDAELDESVKRVFKAFEDEGLKIHGVYVHSLDTKGLTVNGILGLRLGQKIEPNTLRNVRIKLKAEGMTVSKPEVDNHHGPLVNVFFSGIKK